MNDSLAINVLAATVPAAIPIFYSAFGEVFVERSGVLNLGIEGMMLVGAVTGFLVAVHTGSLGLAIMAILGVGLALGLLFAFFVVTLRTEQVVTGLAMTLFGTGLSAYLGSSLVGRPTPVSFQPYAIPGLSEIPALGPIFFQQDVFVYASYFIVPLGWLFLRHTRPGLNVSVVGEEPVAADALGVNVALVRYMAVMFGGVMCALGGAYLSLSYTPSWVENITAGRGWIAFALVIFALWSPVRVMLGALLFGFIAVFSLHLQALGIHVSSFFLNMTPYLVTIVALALTNRRAIRRRIGVPAALGQAYVREEV